MSQTFDTLVAVSGLPGIYRVAANRHNGLIIEDLTTGQRRFAPMRNHQFSLLASIGIYTYDGTIELAEVFRRMDAKKDQLPDAQAADQVVRDYFRTIVEDHDEDKVRISDIRKTIKWYQYLAAHNLIPEPETEPETEPTEAPEKTE